MKLLRSVRLFIMARLLLMIFRIVGNSFTYFSTVRRDKKCVHLIYGVDISVNAGNFMYFAPLNYLLKCGKFNTTQIVKIGEIYA